jgi:hypothetical protein
MPISTVITSAEAPYANISPIPFTITFGADVTGLALSELVATGGSVIRLDGTGSVYTAYLSPTTQGSTVALFVPAAVATGPGPTFDTNAASNNLSSQFLSIRPRARIEHALAAVTNSKRLSVSILFDRDVTGFVANDFSFVNAALYSLTGSGSTYTAIITPLKTGQVEFWVNADAGTDVYGNTSVKSNIVTLMYDPTSYEVKEEAVYGEIKDPGILLDFELTELSQVAEIQSLADCAKNIPQRLLQMAQDKVFALLSSNPDIKKLANTVAIVQKNVETIQAIVKQVQAFAENPETLMQAVLETQGLTGVALQQKMQAITDKFGNVSGLNNIIEAAKSTGICGQQDYYADGSFAPRQILTPTDVAPPLIPGVIAGVQNNTYDSSPKDAYDSFAFQIKEVLELDSKEPQDSDRAQMISLVTTLVMGYHDSVSKTTDASQDSSLYEKFVVNAEEELARNLGWDDKIKTSFQTRTATGGDLVKRSTSIIRAYYKRSAPIAGTPISIGITSYSGPADDYTTFLDIKPEQRPPELTAKWVAAGKKIPPGNTYQGKDKNGNPKTYTSTLNYSDAFTGAYGKPLVDNKSCASTRFPGGSIIALRKPDGSVYDPTGKNPSGQYIVDDTGNSENTWNKPDIFTMTPELYTNMDSVQVFLVSKGTKTNKPQYQLAQSKYGSGGVT